MKRITNEDVVNSFYEGKPNKSDNMSTDGHKLLSYNTAIAERIINDDKTLIIKNVTRYSNTTSKHQALLDKFDYVVTDVPKDEQHLIKYM